MTARADLRAAGVGAHPLAFGITKWGPVPRTRDTWIMWDGPGSGLTSYASDPGKPGAIGQEVRHPAANRTYGTVGEAEQAAAAFVAAFLAAEEADES